MNIMVVWGPRGSGKMTLILALLRAEMASRGSGLRVYGMGLPDSVRLPDFRRVLKNRGACGDLVNAMVMIDGDIVLGRGEDKRMGCLLVQARARDLFVLITYRDLPMIDRRVRAMADAIASCSYVGGEVAGEGKVVASLSSYTGPGSTVVVKDVARLWEWATTKRRWNYHRKRMLSGVDW